MRRVVIVCLVLLAAVMACGKRDHRGEEAMSPKPKMDAGDLADGTEPPEVMPGDKVYLELSIYHPKHIYLTGEVPVSVLAPGGAGLHFAQPQYDLSSPHFPLIIMFEVTREAPARPYTLRLGLRVSYADKADDVVQTRHEVLSVPLLITKRLPRRPKIVHVPLEHYLQLDLDEKHK